MATSYTLVYLVIFSALLLAPLSNRTAASPSNSCSWQQRQHELNSRYFCSAQTNTIIPWPSAPRCCLFTTATPQFANRGDRSHARLQLPERGNSAGVPGPAGRRQGHARAGGPGQKWRVFSAGMWIKHGVFWFALCKVVSKHWHASKHAFYSPLKVAGRKHNKMNCCM